MKMQVALAREVGSCFVLSDSHWPSPDRCGCTVRLPGARARSRSDPPVPPSACARRSEHPSTGGRSGEGSKDGEDAGADEGGGVRAVAVPAEGDAGAVEGHHHQDPPQGLRELDLRHAPPHSRHRHLPVRDVLQGAGKTAPQILGGRSSMLIVHSN